MVPSLLPSRSSSPESELLQARPGVLRGTQLRSRPAMLAAFCEVELHPVLPPGSARARSGAHVDRPSRRPVRSRRSVDRDLPHGQEVVSVIELRVAVFVSKTSPSPPLAPPSTRDLLVVIAQVSARPRRVCLLRLPP